MSESQSSTAVATSAEGKPKREFFGALESLRGVAALLVVVYHLPPWSRTAYELQLVRHSYLLVNFFFVLSGFVLFHSYADRIKSGAGLVRFAVLRLGRLYPIHVVFMAPFVLIELVKGMSILRHGAASDAVSSFYHLGRSVIANIFLVQGLGFGTYEPSLNYPSWSISTEFYTYLLFGATTLLLSKRGFVVVAGVLIAGCVSSLVIFGPALRGFENLIHCVSGFFIGCLTRRALSAFRWRLPLDLPAVLLSGSLLALCSVWNHGGTLGWLEQLSLPVSSLLILSLLKTPSIFDRVLLSRPLRWLGEISYSLYMAHALVLWCVRQILRAVLHTPEVSLDVAGASQLSVLGAFVVYPVAIIATLLVGQVTYRTLEAPLRDAAKRRLTNWFAAQSSV